MSREESNTDVNVAERLPIDRIEADAQTRTRYRRRLEKALNCVDCALECDDPFEASLGAMTGHLMYVNAQLDEAVRDKLSQNDATLDRLRSVLPSLEMGLKVSRQIDRQLQIMRRKPEKPGEDVA